MILVINVYSDLAIFSFWIFNIKNADNLFGCDINYG